VQCRLEHMDKLCQCAPYFYPVGGWLSWTPTRW
jgi:hypothetical protein